MVNQRLRPKKQNCSDCPNKFNDHSNYGNILFLHSFIYSPFYMGGVRVALKTVTVLWPQNIPKTHFDNLNFGHRNSGW